MSNQEAQAIARRCVNSIVIDLADRSGLDGEWEDIDDETKADIEKEWRNIIAVELGGEAE